MTGDIQQIEKESFWKEHQDSLVRIRHDLLSGKKRKTTPGVGIRRTPNNLSRQRATSHPLFGKYRRTPSPYLPKLTPEPSKNLPATDKIYKNKYEVVPSLRPKKAFEETAPSKIPKRAVHKSVPTLKTKKPPEEKLPPLKPKKAFEPKSTEDFDSWGEESSEDDNDSYIDVETDEEEGTDFKRPLKRKKKALAKSPRKHKPQPYPNIQQQYFPPQIVYGAPFPVYYPPPPTGARHGKKQREKEVANKRRLKDAPQKHSSVRKKKKKPVPVYAASYPMMPAVTMMYQPPTEEEEEEEEESEVDEMIQEAFNHWKKHPLFASDYCQWFIQDCLNTEILPDLLIDTLNEIKHMPFHHPLYVPSLYTCEDLLSDHVSEMATEIAREAISELANDYLDEKLLQRDPLEDFLSNLVEDVVRLGTREVVRSTVINMAEDYMQTEYATTIMHGLLAEHLRDIAPDLLEEVAFDIIAEDFIQSQVIAPEVVEEAAVVARETIQYYDDKVIRRQFKEVNLLAKDKLADTVILDYLMSLMFQHGKLWAETDHQNKFLDDMIFNTGLAQIFSIRKNREKTVKCKPLQKLHEKVVSDVALDVFLQHLTRTLDEDLADVDEYERGVTDETSQPFPLVVR
ncbi:hypothetical protein Btru_023847 [Bulinus truncatus]|nr:hypothetical protein Btru_023847 [Bulinus truncatus]